MTNKINNNVADAINLLKDCASKVLTTSNKYKNKRFIVKTIDVVLLPELKDCNVSINLYTCNKK